MEGHDDMSEIMSNVLVTRNGQDVTLQEIFTQPFHFSINDRLEWHGPGGVDAGDLDSDDEEFDHDMDEREEDPIATASGLETNWKELLKKPPRDLETLRNQMTINITKDGLVKKMVLRDGGGKKVPENSKVWIHYVGFIVNEDGSIREETFDSTLRDDRSAHTFRLDTGEAISGLNSAVKTMNLFECAQFLMEPEYAYRLMGCPPRVPENATCVFNVRLMEFMKPEPNFKYDKISLEKFKTLTLDEAFEGAKQLQDIGQGHLKASNLYDAIGCFRRVIDWLELIRTTTEEENSRRNVALSQLRLMMANTLLKCDRPNGGQICVQCKEGLKVCAWEEIGQFKYAFAQAKFILGDYHTALDLIKDAQKRGVTGDDVKKFDCKIRRKMGLSDAVSQ